MAVLQAIRSLFVPVRPTAAKIIAAPPTEYTIRPVTSEQLRELLQLNVRCFINGDSYTKHTFNYLLSEPTTLSYRAVTPAGELVAFVFAMLNENGAAHLTTIGVAPEHRRRGLARRLLDSLEERLKEKDVGTVMLEVRVSNIAAQNLYRAADYYVVQRISNYYNNGEDCFLMMKSLV